MSAFEPRNRKPHNRHPRHSSGCSANQDWEEDTVVLPTEYEEQLQVISRRLEKSHS